MIKGLTQRAQKILTVLAREQARKYRSAELMDEHIMLAILQEKRSTAAMCLLHLKINAAEMAEELARFLPESTGASKSGDLPPSRQTKMLLQNAASEANILQTEYVGTEHFLLAAAGVPGSPTGEYLSRCGVTLEILRRTVYAVSGEDTLNRIRRFRDRQSSSFRSQNAFQGKSEGKVLDSFSSDITAMARAGELDPVVGRKQEISRVMRILARRTKNNPVLIGEPGVGKTAVVEGLAQAIVSGEAPEIFSGKRVLSLDIGALVAGTKFRGEFEDRLKKLIREIGKSRDIILFIDELHTIIGAGGAEGAIDASNMLKPALSRGELQCVGATTLNEYKKYIEKDAALERRFQPVIIREPGIEETLKILQGIRARYEDHHNVTYTDEALQSAAELAGRYIVERQLPDKAIDLIDEAGSHKRMQNNTLPENISDLESRVLALGEKKTEYVHNQDYENAAKVRDQVRELRASIENLKSEWQRNLRVDRNVVTSADIQAIVSENTGIPMVRIVKSESDRLLLMEDELHKTVVGQDEAIAAVSSAIRRSRTGLNAHSRPLGSFIFLGPTGVGKTQLAKSLAEYLFGDAEALVRVDMSDFMEKHNVSRLVGAPPGYVGYEEGGLLTEKIRKRPYSVVLLDEIEKAHHDVFNLLLQVLEEGEIQDSLGHRVSFRNTVLIMTSNAGAREIHRTAFGFSGNGGTLSHNDIKSSAVSELKRIYRPEFLNRVDEIVVFHGLETEHVMRIMDLMLREVASRLREIDITLNVNVKARELLAEKGFDSLYGARSLRRAIQKEMEDPLSVAILEGRFQSGDIVSAEGRSGKIVFYRKNRRRPSPAKGKAGPTVKNNGPAEGKAGPADKNNGPAKGKVGPADKRVGPADSQAGPAGKNNGLAKSKAGPADSQVVAKGADKGKGV